MTEHDDRQQGWRCFGCGCDYLYQEPELVNRCKLCPVCANDQEKVDKANAHISPYLVIFALMLASFCVGVGVGVLL